MPMRALHSPNSAPTWAAIRIAHSKKGMGHCMLLQLCRYTASFQQFTMLTVQNLHQPLFGGQPSAASDSLRRHDQRTDRLDSDLLLAPRTRQ